MKRLPKLKKKAPELKWVKDTQIKDKSYNEGLIDWAESDVTV